MLSMGRLLGIPIFCAVVSLGFITVLTEWLAGTGAAHGLLLLAAEQRRGICLEQESTVVLERLYSKDRIVSQLMAGEITLFQAGARFRALYDTPELVARMQRIYPSSSEGESACLEVIAWSAIRMRITHSPAQGEAIRERLEAELRKHLECYGTVELPE